MTDSTKRRWFQFSMRTLILLVLAGGMVCGWIGIRMRRARTNRQSVLAVQRALDEIQNLDGGTAFVSKRGITVKSKQHRSATWLEQLFDDPGDPHDPDAVWNVSIFYYNATDAGLDRLNELLENLKGSINFEHLSVSSNGMRGTQAILTDAGLEHLKGLTNLGRLSLYGADVTDTSLVHLVGLTNLDSLGLQYTKVTDAGLEHLKGLTNLKALDLGYTNVADAGLEHLKDLTKLEDLHLNNTNVTDAGVKKLQQALPNCKIYH